MSLESVQARIKELSDKLTYCTSSSAEDRYMAELSALYEEEKRLMPEPEIDPEELMLDLIRSKPVLLRGDYLDSCYKNSNDMFRYKCKRLKDKLGEEKFRELFDSVGGMIC